MAQGGVTTTERRRSPTSETSTLGGRGRPRTREITGAERTPAIPPVRRVVQPTKLGAMWRRDIDALLMRIRQLVSEREDRRGAGAGRHELEQRNADIAH